MYEMKEKENKRGLFYSVHGGRIFLDARDVSH